MKGNRIIVHALINYNGKYLVTKRSLNETAVPGYWDIPGGLVEYGELPQDALIRECLEEVNLAVSVENIIYETSNLDENKDLVFTTLIYACKVLDITNLKLQEEEHSKYKFISSLTELKEEKIVPSLEKIMK